MWAGEHHFLLLDGTTEHSVRHIWGCRTGILFPSPTARNQYFTISSLKGFVLFTIKILWPKSKITQLHTFLSHVILLQLSPGLSLSSEHQELSNPSVGRGGCEHKGHQRSCRVSRSPEMEVKELTNPAGLFDEMLAFPKPTGRGAVPRGAAGHNAEMSYS